MKQAMTPDLLAGQTTLSDMIRELALRNVRGGAGGVVPVFVEGGQGNSEALRSVAGQLRTRADIRCLPLIDEDECLFPVGGGADVLPPLKRAVSHATAAAPAGLAGKLRNGLVWLALLGVSICSSLAVLVVAFFTACAPLILRLLASGSPKGHGEGAAQLGDTVRLILGWPFPVVWLSGMAAVGLFAARWHKRRFRRHLGAIKKGIRSYLAWRSREAGVSISDPSSMWSRPRRIRAWREWTLFRLFSFSTDVPLDTVFDTEHLSQDVREAGHGAGADSSATIGSLREWHEVVLDCLLNGSVFDKWRFTNRRNHVILVDNAETYSPLSLEFLERLVEDAGRLDILVTVVLVVTTDNRHAHPDTTARIAQRSMRHAGELGETPSEADAGVVGRLAIRPLRRPEMRDNKTRQEILDALLRRGIELSFEQYDQLLRRSREPLKAFLTAMRLFEDSGKATATAILEHVARAESRRLDQLTRALEEARRDATVGRHLVDVVCSTRGPEHRVSTVPLALFLGRRDTKHLERVLKRLSDSWPALCRTNDPGSVIYKIPHGEWYLFHFVLPKRRPDLVPPGELAESYRRVLSHRLAGTARGSPDFNPAPLEHAAVMSTACDNEHRVLKKCVSMAVSDGRLGDVERLCNHALMKRLRGRTEDVPEATRQSVWFLRQMVAAKIRLGDWGSVDDPELALAQVGEAPSRCSAWQLAASLEDLSFQSTSVDNGPTGHPDCAGYRSLVCLLQGRWEELDQLLAQSDGVTTGPRAYAEMIRRMLTSFGYETLRPDCFHADFRTATSSGQVTLRLGVLDWDVIVMNAGALLGHACRLLGARDEPPEAVEVAFAEAWQAVAHTCQRIVEACRSPSPFEAAQAMYAKSRACWILAECVGRMLLIHGAKVTELEALNVVCTSYFSDSYSLANQSDDIEEELSAAMRKHIVHYYMEVAELAKDDGQDGAAGYLDPASRWKRFLRDFSIEMVVRRLWADLEQTDWHTYDSLYAAVEMVVHNTLETAQEAQQFLRSMGIVSGHIREGDNVVPRQDDMRAAKAARKTIRAIIEAVRDEYAAKLGEGTEQQRKQVRQELERLCGCRVVNANFSDAISSLLGHEGEPRDYTGQQELSNVLEQLQTTRTALAKVAERCCATAYDTMTMFRDALGRQLACRHCTRLTSSLGLSVEGADTDLPPWRIPSARSPVAPKVARHLLIEALVCYADTAFAPTQRCTALVDALALAREQRTPQLFQVSLCHRLLSLATTHMLVPMAAGIGAYLDVSAEMINCVLPEEGGVPEAVSTSGKFRGLLWFHAELARRMQQHDATKAREHIELSCSAARRIGAYDVSLEYIEKDFNESWTRDGIHDVIDRLARTDHWQLVMFALCDASIRFGEDTFFLRRLEHLFNLREHGPFVKWQIGHFLALRLRVARYGLEALKGASELGTANGFCSTLRALLARVSHENIRDLRWEIGEVAGTFLRRTHRYMELGVRCELANLVREVVGAELPDSSLPQVDELLASAEEAAAAERWDEVRDLTVAHDPGDQGSAKNIKVLELAARAVTELCQVRRATPDELGTARQRLHRASARLYCRQCAKLAWEYNDMGNSELGQWFAAEACRETAHEDDLLWLGRYFRGKGLYKASRDAYERAESEAVNPRDRHTAREELNSLPDVAGETQCAGGDRHA